VLTTRWISNALFILAVPVFIVLSNVRIAAMEPRVYQYSFEEYDVPAASGIPREQLDFAARDMVRYFADGRTLLATEVEVDGVEQRLFNERETVHMQDVKDLFQLVFVAHEVAFGYIAIYVTAVFLWAREQSLRKFASRLIVAGTVTAAVLAVGALASLVGFDALFRQFHVLSFANDFWQLDPATDHLIQMFPRDFWFTVTLAVGVATVMEGLLLVLLGYGLRAWVSRPRRGAVEASTNIEATS
jgi:integral membrane protein (TIGR01906 family)